MKFSPTPLAGAFLIDLEHHEDERGFFGRAFCQAEFREMGLYTEIKQSNLSSNRFAGTLRGMHYQCEPHQEAKLVRVMRGACYDVLIDLRKESPTYCQWYGVQLDEKLLRAVYIPEGMAHGFLTLEDDTLVHYEMFAAYHPQSARGVRFDDPAFNIQWPAEVKIIAEKDRQWLLFERYGGKG